MLKVPTGYYLGSDVSEVVKQLKAVLIMGSSDEENGIHLWAGEKHVLLYQSSGTLVFSELNSPYLSGNTSGPFRVAACAKKLINLFQPHAEATGWKRFRPAPLIPQLF